MKELNLIGKTYKEIKNFISDCLIDKEIAILETGEYGMLLFHRSVCNYLTTNFTFIKDSNNSKEINTHVKYSVFTDDFKTKNVVIMYNPLLEIKCSEQERDLETGFPIKSSTLYLKEEIL